MLYPYQSRLIGTVAPQKKLAWTNTAITITAVVVLAPAHKAILVCSSTMSSEVSREIETNEIRDGQSTPRAPSHSTSLEQVFYYYYFLLLLLYQKIVIDHHHNNSKFLI